MSASPSDGNGGISDRGLPWERRGFPNLAGVEGCDGTVRAELEAAGIEWFSLPPRLRGEVPTRIVGSVEPLGWTFERAWRYWVAKGPGLPPEVADRLHEQVGQECRVDGHCAAPSPREWFHGFAVGHYHVDTPQALRALADAIRSVAPGTARGTE